MPTVDLRELSHGEFIVHYGGQARQVDAFTFSRSLIALAEAIQSINGALNPDERLEILIEALGEGSFRAKLKTIPKWVPNLVKSTMTAVVIPLLLAFIYDKFIADKPEPPTIIVTDEYTVIEYGGERIVLPKDAAKAIEDIKNREEIDSKISRTFEVLDEDKSVTDFAIVKQMEDQKPIIAIPRDKFAILAQPRTVILGEQPPRVRTKDDRVHLVVVKAVFKRGKRKWQFVLNGFPISAPIKDEEFFDKLARHEYTFYGDGDVMDVLLRTVQVRDAASGVYMNDPTGYEILRVYGVRSALRQSSLLP